MQKILLRNLSSIPKLEKKVINNLHTLLWRVDAQNSKFCCGGDKNWYKSIVFVDGTHIHLYAPTSLK